MDFSFEGRNLDNPQNLVLYLTFRGSNPSTSEARNLWQKYMKVLRKTQSDVKFRYFAVTELGTQKSRVHLHCLMFCSEDIGRRALEAPWKHGFSNAKLCRPNHVNYVSKYVTKDTARKYASQRLGFTQMPRSSDVSTLPLWYIKQYRRLNLCK